MELRQARTGQSHAGDALRRARELFLSGDRRGLSAIRAEIQASWVRSRHLAIDTDRVEPAYVEAVNRETQLVRCAEPVLRSLAEQLAGEPVSILLTDANGLVLQRLCHDRALLRRLETASLAPGFLYSESSVGTNGIGTALETRTPTLVTGSEHYTEGLGAFTCAGAPIRHPITNNLLGVLDITTTTPHSSPLLLTVAMTAAQRIQDQLLWQATAAEVALMRDYLAACRHTGGPVLALSEDLVMMNALTTRLYDSSDQAALLARITDAAGAADTMSLVTDLPSGVTARLEYRPTFANDALAGGVFRVQTSTQPEHAGSRPSDLIVLPGVVGTSPTWQRVCRGVLHSQRRREWLVLEGEAGVGKLSLLHGAHRATDATAHFRVIDAADMEDASTWLETVADELAGPSGTLVLRRVHLLTPEAVSGLADLLLEQPARDVGAQGPWVAMTLCVTPRNPDVDAQLLPHFPHTIEIPPLRHHMEDLPRLVPHLLRQACRQRDLTVSSTALNQLMRLPWQGNIEQLRRVLVRVAKQRRSGVVHVDDLPPECRATSRRQLSPLESLERDAIVSALDSHSGRKDLAAASLGMSRATIYRKIKEYGIAPRSRRQEVPEEEGVKRHDQTGGRGCEEAGAAPVDQASHDRRVPGEHQ